MDEPADRPFVPDLRHCTCCPRGCGADRTSTELGYCGSGAGYSIGSICAHRGEEPVISGSHGICNIFFTRCNMQCLFCQNYDISRNTEAVVAREMDLEELIEQIDVQLDRGCRSVGFVSPSHYLPQMLKVIEAIKKRGRSPVSVFNTNGYDRLEAIRALDGLIDVYLPDFKYMDEALAREFSDAPGYPAIARRALGEMFRQKGPDITLDSDGLITSGMIIRHLVLPGHVRNSIEVLQHIAVHWSPDCHLSLMSQYWPTPAVANHPTLGRRITEEEYDLVLEAMENLGFSRGWVQELGSSDHYRPDFMRDHPFER
jgi:putative pyruvate formate lyase activating enzyme